MLLCLADFADLLYQNVLMSEITFIVYDKSKKICSRRGIKFHYINEEDNVHCIEITILKQIEQLLASFTFQLASKC